MNKYLNLPNSEHLRSDFKNYECTELSLIYSGVRYEVRLRLQDLFKASQLILVHNQVWEPPWYEGDGERERERDSGTTERTSLSLLWRENTEGDPLTSQERTTSGKTSQRRWHLSWAQKHECDSDKFTSCF